jgi:rod shape-determining protein MreD
VRSALAWCGVGLLLIVLEGALAQGFSVRFIPDFSLLVTIAAALAFPPGRGMILAVVFGLGTDMLSGSLLGQVAFLRLLEFGLAQALAGQLDLRRTVPAAVFAATLVGIDSLGLVGLSRLFLGGFPVAWSELVGLAPRALLTGACAPFVLGLAIRVGDALSESDARREMRIETRRPVL